MTDSLEQWIKDFEAKIKHLENERDSWKSKFERASKVKNLLKGKDDLRYKLMAEEELSRVLAEQRDELTDRWEHLKFHLVAEQWPDDRSREIAFGIVELMVDLDENPKHDCSYASPHPGLE